MKKIVGIFLLMLFVIFSLSVNAQTAEVPMRDFYFLGRSSGAYLIDRENKLYFANDLTKNNKKLIDTDVETMIFDSTSGNSDYYIKKDGGLVNLSDGKVFNMNAKSGIYIDDYIDDGLILLQKDDSMVYFNERNLSVTDSATEKILDNADKIKDGYVLDKDGNLYAFEEKYNDSYNFNENYVRSQYYCKIEFIMSGVKDFYKQGLCFCLTNNGEMFVVEDEFSWKILSGVKKFIENIALLENGEVVLFDVVRKDSLAETTTLGTDFNDIYYAPDYSIYYLKNDGNLFREVNNQLKPVAETTFYFDKENNYYSQNDWKFEEMGRVIKKVSKSNVDVILNEKGEIWYKDSYDDNTFLTPMSTKNLIIKINNEICQLTNRIQMIDGRSMYPFRECLELIGAKVSWDGEKQIAIGEVPGIKIEFPIGKNEYLVNGVKYEMDAKAYIDEGIGRTYIPIRYAAEGLGYKVDWIEEVMENTISIYKEI